MPNGKLYAFKLTGQAHVWVLLGDRRAWIRSQAMATAHQVDTATVAIVQSDSPLWLLGVVGPLPPS